MSFNQFTWNLYKESEQGKRVINSFLEAAEEVTEFDLLERYNPHQAKFIKKEAFADTCETIWCYGISENEKPANWTEAKDLYESLIIHGVSDGEYAYIDREDYKLMLYANALISFLLYYFSPEYFTPNLFTYRFFDLNKIADTFNINLPAIPKKSDYKARCMYYVDLCETLYNFRIENNLSPDELCAFLYEFAPNFVTKENKNIPEPAQAWFIGGLISEEEQDLDLTFWQGNKDTKKGDILIHYETSPISAITTIWIAQTDGVVDPFFHYYSNVYIGEKTSVQKITIKDLKQDAYFLSHPLVRKSFQGVNGWSVSSEDYSQLLRMINEKGGNIDVLPKLYAPASPVNVDVKNERDVEIKLLEYYLAKMGFAEHKDYIRQLGLHAGTGSRIYPDYALHFDNTPGYEKAKVLIEAKFLMKNNQEIETAFKQARSYALILEASIIILCDKNCLIVYEKLNSFDRGNYIKYYWGEFNNPDVFNQLKNKLRK